MFLLRFRIGSEPSSSSSALGTLRPKPWQSVSILSLRRGQGPGPASSSNPASGTGMTSHRGTDGVDGGSASLHVGLHVDRGRIDGAMPQKRLGDRKIFSRGIEHVVCKCVPKPMR